MQLFASIGKSKQSGSMKTICFMQLKIYDPIQKAEFYLLTENEIVKELSVDEGSSVILNCSCKSESKITWYGPSKPTTSSDEGEKYLILYTDGCDLDPDFYRTNINFICNNATEECNLEISNFSSIDEGVYKCLTSNFTAHVYNVFVKSKYMYEETV